MRYCENCKYAKKYEDLNKDQKRIFEIEAKRKYLQKEDYLYYILCTYSAIPSVEPYHNVCEDWEAIE